MFASDQSGNYWDGEDFFSRLYFPRFQGHRRFFKWGDMFSLM